MRWRDRGLSQCVTDPQNCVKPKIFMIDILMKYVLMIKAVLLSRLAMTQDSIRNTHTQMLWEKGFRGETLPVLVTKYGQNVIPKTHVTLH